MSDAIVPLDHQLLTADEVAELLRLPVSTIYDLALTGRLPHLKIGRALRFSRSDLEAHLAERCRAHVAAGREAAGVASASRPSRAPLRGSLRSALTGRP